MSRPDVAAAILAGGRARRFEGRDKSRLLIEGRPIIVRQLEALRQVAGEIFVVGGEPDRFADVGLTVHADVEPGCGAIGGVLTAVTVAPSERVLVVACDLPYLAAPLLARLAELAEHADAAWVRGGRGAEPLLACYRRTARAPIAAAIAAGRLALADLEHVLQVAVVGADELATFGPADRLVANVNSADDMRRIESDSQEFDDPPRS
jgi:molybdopterin-guanine dinucleotide biosynthesis protein A